MLCLQPLLSLLMPFLFVAVSESTFVKGTSYDIQTTTPSQILQWTLYVRPFFDRNRPLPGDESFFQNIRMFLKGLIDSTGYTSQLSLQTNGEVPVCYPSSNKTYCDNIIDIYVTNSNTFITQNETHYYLNFTQPSSEIGADFFYFITNIPCEELKNFPDWDSVFRDLAGVEQFIRDHSIRVVFFFVDAGSSVSCDLKQDTNALKQWLQVEDAFSATLDQMAAAFAPDNVLMTAMSSSTASVDTYWFSSTSKPDEGNNALLYAIIAICATVIIVAVCCGCICILKMRYRFNTLRVNFYGRNLFRRNMHGSTLVSNPTAVNEYIETAIDTFDKWEILAKNLHVDKNQKLGSGAFAAVFKGYLTGKNPLLENASNINFALEMAENRENEVAVKMLHTHADELKREELKKEIEFMKTLGYHPHVLNLIGCVSSIYDPLLVVEYCANGDLLTLLRKHKDYILTETNQDCPVDADFCLALRDLLSFAWQISDGMVYMSSRNFIHRDVAARNVLITKRMVAKISDFGLCRYTQEALYTTKGGKLPIKWMAQEALKQAEFTSKTDVWAYGVLLYELFSIGDTPYHHVQPSDMASHLTAGNRLERPELCPEEIYALMREMWCVNPDDRPTFEEIRHRLSNFLEIASDAYGYIQVNQDYNRLYSLVEPHPVHGTAPLARGDTLYHMPAVTLVNEEETESKTKRNSKSSVSPSKSEPSEHEAEL